MIINATLKLQSPTNMPTITKEKTAHTRDLFRLIKDIPQRPYFEDNDRDIILFKEDCLDIFVKLPENSIDMIFADPPYFLSNGGITCYAGKMVSVNKGKWDKSQGVEADHEFKILQEG